MLGFVNDALTWGQMQYFGRSSRVIEGKSGELKDMTIWLFTRKIGGRYRFELWKLNPENVVTSL